jgi:hypothetical protein
MATTARPTQLGSSESDEDGRDDIVTTMPLKKRAPSENGQKAVSGNQCEVHVGRPTRFVLFLFNPRILCRASHGGGVRNRVPGNRPAPPPGLDTGRLTRGASPRVTHRVLHKKKRREFGGREIRAPLALWFFEGRKP